jgi:hypothetical protein
MRTFNSTVAALALALLVAAPALAANVHFVEGPVVTATSTSVTTSGKLAGLGNKDVTLVQSIDVAVTCANPGHNEDVPGQRQSFTSTVTGLHPENGNLVFSITTDHRRPVWFLPEPSVDAIGYARRWDARRVPGRQARPAGAAGLTHLFSHDTHQHLRSNRAPLLPQGAGEPRSRRRRKQRPGAGVCLLLGATRARGVPLRAFPLACAPRRDSSNRTAPPGSRDRSRSTSSWLTTVFLDS